MSVSTTRITDRNTPIPTSPRLVWTRPGDAPSFADLPSASIAFRAWLGTILLLSVVTVVAAVGAESIGLPGGPIAMMGGFILAVAALNYPSSIRARPRLRIVA
jgi:hypothetical protein